MGQGGQERSLRCWIGIHSWVTKVNANARWHECRRCGKYSGNAVASNRFPPGGMGDGAGGFS